MIMIINNDSDYVMVMMVVLHCLSLARKCCHFHPYSHPTSTHIAHLDDDVDDDFDDYDDYDEEEEEDEDKWDAINSDAYQTSGICC